MWTVWNIVECMSEAEAHVSAAEYPELLLPLSECAFAVNHYYLDVMEYHLLACINTVHDV